MSCRLGRTLRKPLAARDELLTSPFLRPSVTLRDRQESGEEVNNINITPCGGAWHRFSRASRYNSPKSPETYPSLMSEYHSLQNREDTAAISDSGERVVTSIPARNAKTTAQRSIRSCRHFTICLRIFCVTNKTSVIILRSVLALIHSLSRRDAQN